MGVTRSMLAILVTAQAEKLSTKRVLKKDQPWDLTAPNNYVSLVAAPAGPGR
jgi:hypothetical protein